MKKNKTGPHSPDKIHIEINAHSLAKAVATGSLAACDIRGLTLEAKQSLWRICLQACINN
ncbi:MAG: hypothetical protein ACJA0N_000183 [Pseudohongiellaceae bacterium]|jgi:hypothetical protein